MPHNPSSLKGKIVSPELVTERATRKNLLLCPAQLLASASSPMLHLNRLGVSELLLLRKSMFVTLPLSCMCVCVCMFSATESG